jgi:hypothetical protein
MYSISFMCNDLASNVDLPRIGGETRNAILLNGVSPPANREIVLPLLQNVL